MTQSEALDILKTGASVFLTGNAGSGKTYLLNQYISWLKACGIGYAVTASTGIAATHISGMTIHSFTGVGIRKFLTQRDLDELAERKYLWDRFNKLKVLIIDEISMLPAGMLDMVNAVCQTFKQNDQPFGGLQIILTGDFFQLPPVDHDNASDPRLFAYNSMAWQSLDPVVTYLSEQHRQTDAEFTEILNAIRATKVTPDTIAKLRSRIGAVKNGKDHARLYAHNEDVDRVNQDELLKLDGRVFEYEMHTHGKGALVESLQKSVLAPELLSLKEGALVMCVKNNYEKGYVNGTLGTVISCDIMAPTIRTHTGKVIRMQPESWLVEENGKVKAEVSQIPLRLAWAITIHKSQGMSMDAAHVDLSRSFTPGMGYVALSRVRSLDGLTLEGLNDMALSVHADVATKDTEFQRRSEYAAEAIERMGEAELDRRQRGFVSRSGGTWKTTDEARREEGTAPSRSGRHAGRKPKGSTEEETARLIGEGKSVAAVAKERDLTIGTVISHLERLIEKDADISIGHIEPSAKDFKRIRDAFKASGDTKLAPVKTILDEQGYSYTFEEIRVARLFI